MTLFPILTVTFIHTLWIGTLLGLGALATRLILHRAQPQLRYIAALAWLFLLACSPLLIAGYLSFNHHSTSPIQTVSSTPASFSARPAASSALTSSPPPIFTAEPFPIADHPINTWVAHRHTLTTLLPILWITGAGVMLLWSLLGLAGAERLRQTASLPDPSADQMLRALARRLSLGTVDLLVSPRVTSPILIGILKPAILLPPALLTNLTPSQLELILLHELAHVRRLDNLINLLQRLIESLLFFHPAVWLVSSWARQEREHCCDDFVLKSADPHEYAAILLSLHQSRLPFSMAATGSNLPARIRRILTRHDSMRLSRTSLTILAIPLLLTSLLLAHAAAAPAAPEKIITVAKKGGDYTNIQSAIDAAPAGAIIRIAPGTWQENLTISKSVSLEGARWDQTTILAFKPIEVVRVENAHDVTILNLKIASTPGPGPVHSELNPTSLILFDHATGRLDHCAIVGSPGYGVVLSEGSDAQITHCLIAAVWSDGILVGSYTAGPATAVISDCDVRNCYHYGIWITPKSNATVERCRIWGTAWHGIRYDDASPTIRDNRIYSVARLCIYASGHTHATVTGNIIAGSEMSGMWCLPGNQDVIAENTFTQNTEAGIQVSGDSSPTVKRNIFFYQPVAVACYAENAKNQILGHPQLISNWLWPDPRTATPLQPGVDSTTHVQEIRLMTSPGDYWQLPPDAPARAAHVGAANLPSAISPFPIQPQESAIIPNKASYDYQLWQHQS